MSKNKDAGWENAWRIYPKESFKKSIKKTFWLEMFCSIILAFSTTPYSELISVLCSFVNGGYPSIVGFVLSGYALLIGFGNSEVTQKLSVKLDGRKNALFQEINATFAMMLLFLIVTLLLSFLISTVAASQIDTWGIPSKCIDFVNVVVFHVFLFFILYSLLSLLDVVMNIFNFGQFAYFVNNTKKEKEGEGQERPGLFKNLVVIFLCMMNKIKNKVKEN